MRPRCRRAHALSDSKFFPVGYTAIIAVALMFASGEASAQRQRISFTEFVQHFRNGRPIVAKVIPAAYIEEVLEDPKLAKTTRVSALDVRQSVIEGELLLLSPPEKPVSDANAQLRPYLAKRSSFSSVNVPLRFSSTHIKPRVSMPNVVFEQEVSFRDVVVCQDLDFAGSIFVQDVNFQGGSVRGNFVFSTVTLMQGLSVADVEFKKAVNFSLGIFPVTSKISFTNNKYADIVNFGGSVVAGAVSFDTGTFLGDAFFNDVNHKSEADEKPEISSVRTSTETNKAENNGKSQGQLSFRDVVFHKRAYFDRSLIAKLEFGDPEYHRPVRFEANSTFAGAVLDVLTLKDAEGLGWTDLSQAKFGKTVDLRWTYFSEGGDFTASTFLQGCVLDIEGARFREPIRINWDQIKDSIPNVGRGELLVLEENFKRLHDLKSLNEAFYRRRDRTENDPLNKLWWITCGYGVRPLRPALWLLVIAGLFWVLNLKLLPEGRNRAWTAAQVMGSVFKAVSPPFQFGEGFLGILTIVAEWIVFKVFQIMFLVALFNTAPFLKELVPKPF